MQSKNRLKSNRPRVKDDFYQTPFELCDIAIQKFFDDEDYPFIDDAIDAGSGTGRWGNALIEQYPEGGFVPDIIGIDVNEYDRDYCYKKQIVKDFLTYIPEYYVDLVYGNPPYKLAEEFVRKAEECLTDGGYCYFLLRLAFLESKKRYFGLFKDWKPKRVYVLSRRPSFFTTKNGNHTVDSLSYAMFLWKQGWSGETTLDWLYWDYLK